ncbi:DDB1- and CUL4-associated factor 5-like [Styela clava]
MERHPTIYLKNLQISGNTRASCLFHRKRLEDFESMYVQNLNAHYGCINALEFSNEDGNFLASGGDDKRVVLWNLTLAMLKPNYQPVVMHATHLSNIFCLTFNMTDDKLISSGNDGQVILHDLHTNNLVDVFMCDNSVYGLSSSPSNEHLVAAACEDGTVHIIDTRLTKADGLCLARRSSAFHSVMFSPVDHHLIATSHSRDGMALWDIRSPKKEVLHYGQRGSKQRAMSARFNKTGNQLLCLRRRQCLALYNISDSKSIAEFDCDGYSNYCTMKSCCFAGDKDQYIVSGSDDFGVYMWKLPGEYEGKRQHVGNAFKVLRGHRSIVNQVRFNRHSNLLVSCGVEKMVKLWSTERLPMGGGDVFPSCEKPRKRYSHNEYIQLIFESSGMVHDYHAEDMEEDPKMLAFFDSLVQHEADDRTSDSSNCDSSVAIQLNDYFSTHEENTTNSESLTSDDGGPASLDTLGIGDATTNKSAAQKASQKKLRRLREKVKEDSDWRVQDFEEKSSSELPRTSCSNSDEKLEDDQPTTSTSVSSAKVISPVKTKRRRKERESVKACSSDTSDSENEAARTRQRNAHRRVRRPFRISQSSDNGSPSTSGLCSSTFSFNNIDPHSNGQS